MFDRRDFVKTFLAGGASLLVLRELSSAQALGRTLPALPFDYADDPWTQVAEILKRIKAPAFPQRDFNIARFGAVANGNADCTEAFRKAIDACSKAGGGRVVVPAGEFSTGAIHLQSH